MPEQNKAKAPPRPSLEDTLSDIDEPFTPAGETAPPPLPAAETRRSLDDTLKDVDALTTPTKPSATFGRQPFPLQPPTVRPSPDFGPPEPLQQTATRAVGNVTGLPSALTAAGLSTMSHIYDTAKGVTEDLLARPSDMFAYGGLSPSDREASPLQPATKSLLDVATPESLYSMFIKPPQDLVNGTIRALVPQAVPLPFSEDETQVDGLIRAQKAATTLVTVGLSDMVPPFLQAYQQEGLPGMVKLLHTNPGLGAGILLSVATLGHMSLQAGKPARYINSLTEQIVADRSKRLGPYEFEGDAAARYARDVSDHAQAARADFVNRAARDLGMESEPAAALVARLTFDTDAEGNFITRDLTTPDAALVGTPEQIASQDQLAKVQALTRETLEDVYKRRAAASQVTEAPNLAGQLTGTGPLLGPLGKPARGPERAGMFGPLAPREEAPSQVWRPAVQSEAFTLAQRRRMLKPPKPAPATPTELPPPVNILPTPEEVNAEVSANKSLADKGLMPPTSVDEAAQLALQKKLPAARARVKAAVIAAGGTDAHLARLTNGQLQDIAKAPAPEAVAQAATIVQNINTGTERATVRATIDKLALDHGVTLPPPLRDAASAALDGAPLPDLKRFSKALAIAKRTSDPRATIQQAFERLGTNGIATRVAFRPETAPSPLEMGEAALPIDPAIVRDALNQVGDYYASTAEVASKQGLSIRAAENLSNQAGAVGRRQGGTLATLRDEATSHGLTLDPDGAEFVLRNAATGAEVFRSRSLIGSTEGGTGILERIRTSEPQLPPSAPFAPRKPNPEAGSVPVGLLAGPPLKAAQAVAALGRRAVSPLRMVWDPLTLGQLSPTQGAKEFTGLVPGLPEYVGQALIGGPMIAAEHTSSFIQDYHSQVGRLFDTAGIRPGNKADLAVREVLNAVKLTEHAPNGAWVTNATEATPSAKLTLDTRPNLDPARALEALKLWDSLTTDQRKATLGAAKWLAETYDQLNEAGRVSYHLRKARSYYSATDIERLKQLPPPAGFEKLVGNHIDAYFPHALGDKWAQNLLNENLDKIALPGNLSREAVADTFYRAIQADATHPFTDGNFFTEKPSDALRHLIPGISNEDLQTAIMIGERHISGSAGFADRVWADLPQTVYAPFLKQRLSNVDINMGARDLLDSYALSAARKIHMEPAVRRVIPLIDDMALKPQFKDQARWAENYLNIIQGKRGRITDAGQAAVKALGGIMDHAYQAAILLQPHLVLQNLTQTLVFGHPEVPFSPAGMGLATSHDFGLWLADQGILSEGLPAHALVNYSKARGIPQIQAGALLVDDFGRLWRSHDMNSARLLLNDLYKAGLTVPDLMTAAETVNRKLTAAMSVAHNAEQLGIADLVRTMGMDEVLAKHPEKFEALLHQMVIDMGNVNFFMGRGTNSVYWLHALKQTPLRPIVSASSMFTSFPLGVNAQFMASARHMFTADPAYMRSGARRMGQLWTGILLLGGPYAAIHFADDLDAFVAKHGKDDGWERGDVLQMFDKWQQNASGMGLLFHGVQRLLQDEQTGARPSQPDLDRMVGIDGSIPVMAIEAGVKHTAPTLGKVFMKPPLQLMADGFQSLKGLGRHELGGAPYNDDEKQAINRLLPPYFAKKAGAGGGQPLPGAANLLLSPDIAMQVLGGVSIYKYLAASVAGANARPGLHTDIAGHGTFQRTPGDDVMFRLGGSLLSESKSRWRVQEGQDENAFKAATRHEMTVAALEGDAATFQKLQKTWSDKYPGSMPFKDVNDLYTTATAEQLRRSLTTEEANFNSLHEAAAMQRLQLAQKRLASGTLSQPEIEVEKHILVLGAKRFTK